MNDNEIIRDTVWRIQACQEALFSCDLAIDSD